MAEDGTLDTLDTGAEAPADDRAADLAEAFDQVETRDTTQAPAGTPDAAPAALSPAGDRVRGPDGRYLPADAQKPAGGPGSPGEPPTVKQPLPTQQKQPGQAPAAPAPTEPSLRPPVSWKPGAREHWAKLPPDVQQEVVRRETETARVLQDSAKAREALSHVQQVLGPYAANIQASGADAIGVIDNFFRTDNTLRHGSTVDKAQMTAQIIKHYGIDLNTLDNILAGQQVAPDPQEGMLQRLRQETQQQIQPVMQFFQQMQGRRQEHLGQIEETSRNNVHSFAEDGAHEFFEDVRVDMADIIDMYAARDQPITLQQAYDKAILLNPQVAEIVQRRAEAARVNTQAQAAQRARRAAASISGSPAPAGSPGAAGADRRAEIESAWDQAGSG